MGLSDPAAFPFGNVWNLKSKTLPAKYDIIAAHAQGWSNVIGFCVDEKESGLIENKALSVLGCVGDTHIGLVRWDRFNGILLINDSWSKSALLNQIHVHLAGAFCLNKK